MKIQYTGTTILTDNDLLILDQIFTIIRYSDPEFELKITKKVDELICYIMPSNVLFRPRIIQNLLWINKYIKFKIEYSKSLKISKGVWFKISL